MNLRPDYVSLGFFLGVGCLKLTRGLGPCTGVPLVPEEPVHARDGGAAPYARATQPKQPTVVGVEIPGRGAKKGTE